jgi:O-antigen/teichoic acid export membrane protein
MVAAILDALGRPGVIARMSVGWTALNWVVTPLATWRWGFPGFVYGMCVPVVVGNVAVLFVVHHLVPEARLAKPLWGPAAGGLLVAAIGWFVLRPWADTPLKLAAGVAVALAAHLAAFAAVDPQAFRAAKELVFGAERGKGLSP